MKNEINAMLNADHATLRINDYFYLRRWQLHRDTDILGRDGDCLELVLDFKGVFARTQSIKSRTVHGIQGEVSDAMVSMMRDASDAMVRRWRGGQFCTTRGSALQIKSEC